MNGASDGTTDGRCPLCPSLPSAPLSRRSRLLIRPTRVFSRRTPRPDAEPGEQRGEERTPCASRCLSRSESGPRRPPGPRPTAASRGTGPVSGPLGRGRCRPAPGGRSGERRPRAAGRGADPAGSTRPGRAAAPPHAARGRGDRPPPGRARTPALSMTALPAEGRWRGLPGGTGPIRSAPPPASSLPVARPRSLPRSSSSQRCHYPSRSPLAPRPSLAPPPRAGVRRDEARQRSSTPRRPAPIPYRGTASRPLLPARPGVSPPTAGRMVGDGSRSTVDFRPRFPVGRH